MAKPTNTTPRRHKGTPFKKGDDPRRNTGGRPPIPEDVKRARKLTLEEFTRAVNKIISMRNSELEKFAGAADSNVLEVFVARLFLMGIKDARRSELEFFLDRFLGKVSENHNFTGNMHGSLMAFMDARNGMKENGKQEEGLIGHTEKEEEISEE